LNRPPPTLETLLDKLKHADASTLAKCITLMECGGPSAESLHRRIAPLTGRAAIIGFTGPPGVGKSTLIDAYIGALRARGHTVAVAAVDPSSPISGGAILGDRVRMQRHTDDAGVFIRSIASRGHLGGLSESIHRIVDVMDAAGRDFVIVETVGTGQSEIEIVEIADVCVVVNAPNSGDDVQAIKAGVLEIADVLVVNKADLPLSDRTARQLRSMLKLRRENQDVPVIETVATQETGIDSLRSAIESRIGRSADEKVLRRARRMRRLIAQRAGYLVRDLVLDSAGEEMDALVKAASAGDVDLATAVRRALKTVL